MDIVARDFDYLPAYESTMSANNWREYEKPAYDVQAALPKIKQQQKYKEPVSIDTQNMQLQKLLAYAELCGRLFVANTSMFQFFVVHQKYVEDSVMRKKLQNYIEKLTIVCQKARERLQENDVLTSLNEKVLFSSLALKTIIQNLLDKDFMEQIGVDDTLTKVDIIEFGKGIDEAEKIDI